MNEEKLRVLKLLEEKKVTSAEAMELIDALGKPAPGGSGGRRGRVLRIRIYEDGGTAPKANVSIPLEWAKLMAPFIESRIVRTLADKGHSIDQGKMRAAIDSQVPVKIIDVQDGGDRVEMFIE